MIHPLAVVGEDAAIGVECKVWQFASIIRGATLGAGCVVGAGAIIDGATVGHRCQIGSGAQLHPGTRIGNRVFVGPGAIICNDLWPSADKTGFDLAALLAGNTCTVCIDDDVAIGAGAIIMPGVSIGFGAIIAAGVVCDRSVPRGKILRRDGSLDDIPVDRMERRMRPATC